MADFIKTVMIGNLGRDAETRYTPSGAMNVTFSVAINPPKFGDKEPETQWWRVTAWGKLAERLDKGSQDGWFGKGCKVYLEGRPEVRTYQAKDGSGTRVSLELNASEVQVAKYNDRPEQPAVYGKVDADEIPF